MANEPLALIEARIEESIAVKRAWGSTLKQRLVQAAAVILECASRGGRVLLVGNGGSAADAEHFATELVGRFLRERKPLDAIALTTNSPTLTALANDYDASMLFARQVTAHARKGDILVAISTSGNSPNILRAIEAAREQQAIVIGMTGESGGRMADKCDILLNIPSSETPRIQESHVLAMHLLCELVEREL